MNKQQIIVLLDKVIETLDSQDIDKWPANVHYEISFNEKKISQLDLQLKRCNVCLWEDNGGLGIVFKIGINSINNRYKRPNFINRYFCPVWRKWKNVKEKVVFIHKEHKERVAKKQLDEQVEVFNSLYYSQFPDEIDDILLDDDD